MLECAVFHKNNLGWQRNELYSGQTFPFHRIFTSNLEVFLQIILLSKRFELQMPDWTQMKDILIFFHLRLITGFCAFMFLPNFLHTLLQ